MFRSRERPGNMPQAENAAADIAHCTASVHLQLATRANAGSIMVALCKPLSNEKPTSTPVASSEA